MLCLCCCIVSFLFSQETIHGTQTGNELLHVQMMDCSLIGWAMDTSPHHNQSVVRRGFGGRMGYHHHKTVWMLREYEWIELYDHCFV